MRMATLRQLIDFLNPRAAEAKNITDLLSLVKSEFPKDRISLDLVERMHAKFEKGDAYSVPETLREIFGAIGTKPKPEAVKPTPAPKAQPVITPTAIGEAVISTVTSQDPTVRSAAQGALTTITNAARLMARSDFSTLTPSAKASFIRSGGRLVETKAQANTSAGDVEPNAAKPVLDGATPAGLRPDFSFLPLGQAKQRMIAEFDENGGLAETSWFTWFAARKAFTTTQGITPEAATGHAVVIPGIVLETKSDAAKRLVTWAAGDAYFEAKIAAFRADLVTAKGRDRDRLMAALANVREQFSSYQTKRQADYDTAIAETRARIAAKRSALF